MKTREEIENEIRNLLATETRTTVLSNKLFQQDTGLFMQMATTESERRELTKSELFRSAQRRVRELEHRDAKSLKETAKIIAEQFPNREFSLTIDPTPAPL